MLRRREWAACWWAQEVSVLGAWADRILSRAPCLTLAQGPGTCRACVCLCVLLCVAVNTSACESGKDGGGRCPPQAPAIPSAILRKPQSGNSATRGTVAFPRSAPRARGAPGWSRCAISDPVPLETPDADACLRPWSWLSSSTGFALARNQCQSRCPAYLGPNRQWSLCRLWFCLLHVYGSGLPTPPDTWSSDLFPSDSIRLSQCLKTVRNEFGPGGFRPELGSGRN